MSATTTEPVKPGERRACEVCGTAYVGALVLNSPGRPGWLGPPDEPVVLPVTLVPDDEAGNVLLQQHDGVLRAIVFGEDSTTSYLRDRGVQLRRAHFHDDTTGAA